MTGRSIAALLVAVVATTIATIASIACWAGHETLVTVAVACWVMLGVLLTADRTDIRVEQAALRMERAGDARHGEGVMEGMRQATQPFGGLREVK